jgi:hypothetical protein
MEYGVLTAKFAKTQSFVPISETKPVVRSLSLCAGSASGFPDSVLPTFAF